MGWDNLYVFLANIWKEKSGETGEPAIMQFSCAWGYCLQNMEKNIHNHIDLDCTSSHIYFFVAGIHCTRQICIGQKQVRIFTSCAMLYNANNSNLCPLISTWFLFFLTLFIIKCNIPLLLSLPLVVPECCCRRCDPPKDRKSERRVNIIRLMFLYWFKIDSRSPETISSDCV